MRGRAVAGRAIPELLAFCRHEPRCQSLQKAGHLVDVARHVAGGGAIRGAAHLHRHRRFRKGLKGSLSVPSIPVYTTVTFPEQEAPKAPSKDAPAPPALSQANPGPPLSPHPAGTNGP